MKYSEGFRNSVLSKVLPPNDRSVASVAREYGISSLTIHNWLSRLKEGRLEIVHGSSELAPNERGIKEKYRILLESRRVSSEDMGEWLRQQGLHSEHLSLWEQELEDTMTKGQQGLRRENAILKKENKELRREAQRDKAAMAEALALLTLKKKADALWGQDVED